MAEAIFNSLAGGGAFSAGLEPAEYVDENVITVLKEIGVKAVGLKPKKLTPSMLREADRIVAFKCKGRIPQKFRGKVQEWSIGAESAEELKALYSIDYLRKIRDEIYENIRKLLQDLNGAKHPKTTRLKGGGKVFTLFRASEADETHPGLQGWSLCLKKGEVE